MKQYKDIDKGKRIHVSGWALISTHTGEPVLSGQRVYTLDTGKNGVATVTNGTPPFSADDEGCIWCGALRDELKPRRFGLRWVKLDSEGEPLY